MSDHAAEQHGLTPRQYVYIGAILTVITGIELWLSYSGLAHSVLVPLLLVLSAVKFATVVALFMHLRFEGQLFRMMFVGPFILAALVLLALITLLWTDMSHVVHTVAH